VIGDRLRSLYARAVLRRGEARDEGRLNEARNAAVLLINTIHEAGGILIARVGMDGRVVDVQISGERPPPPKPAPSPSGEGPVISAQVAMDTSCRACGLRIKAGSWAWWRMGAGHTHQECGSEVLR